MNREYATEVGFPFATYLESSRENLLPIGVEHRSKAILGKGTIREVHKALNIRDGEGFAIKVLSGGGESEMKGKRILSQRGLGMGVCMRVEWRIELLSQWVE